MQVIKLVKYEFVWSITLLMVLVHAIDSMRKIGSQTADGFR